MAENRSWMYNEHKGNLFSAAWKAGLERKKHGPNWITEHPDFDTAVLYEEVGRTPHGRLAIGDEAISITEKEQIKTRARRAHPYVSAREMQLEREVDRLKKRNKRFLGLEHVVRVLAAKGGYDYDALVQETAPELATSESDVGFSRKHGRGVQNGTELDNTNGGNHGCEDDEDYKDGEDDDYYYEGDDYNDSGHYGPDDEGDDYNDDGGYYGPDDENLWD